VTTPSVANEQDENGAAQPMHRVVKVPKLVRSRMPEIYAFHGDVVALRPAVDDAEFRRFLIAKVREELDEYEQDPSDHELADLFETLRGLAILHGGYPKVERARLEKHAVRGGFEDRLILTEFQWGPGVAPAPAPDLHEAILRAANEDAHRVHEHLAGVSSDECHPKPWEGGLMRYLAKLVTRSRAPAGDSDMHVLGALHAARMDELRENLRLTIEGAKRDSTPRDAVELAAARGACAADERLLHLLDAETHADVMACLKRARQTMPHRPARGDVFGEPRSFYERLDAAYEREYARRLAYWGGYWSGHLDSTALVLKVRG